MTSAPHVADWEPFFNPLDVDLWANASDVNWMKGSWVRSHKHPAALAKQWPFIPPTRTQAASIIRIRHEQVLAILGGLFSWRTATVDQLRAGLVTDGMRIDAFARDVPTVWGALLKLGAIDVGFSKAEVFDDRRVNQVWVQVGSMPNFTKEITDTLNLPAWMRGVLTSGDFRAVHSYARHNTLTNHVGLTAAHDDRVRFTCGDGWGGFRYIDPQAVAEIGGAGRQVADMLAFLSNGVTMALEVQLHSSDVTKKLKAWSKFLAYSPMSRRGLVNIWLQPPLPDGVYPNYLQSFKNIASDKTMTVGTPIVAQRLGYARWEEWFDPAGKPLPQWGEYEDLTGTRRSVFDEQWKQYTPTLNPVSTVCEWGWQLMNERIRQAWGWDISAWDKPASMRGGFWGFVGHDITSSREEEPHG